MVLFERALIKQSDRFTLLAHTAVALAHTWEQRESVQYILPYIFLLLETFHMESK